MSADREFANLLNKLLNEIFSLAKNYDTAPPSKTQYYNDLYVKKCDEWLKLNQIFAEKMHNSRNKVFDEKNMKF